MWVSIFRSRTLSDDDIWQRVMSYIKSGLSEGATIHHGGSRVGSPGYFIEPTIFTNAKPGMKIVNEEIFGPVGLCYQI
jgi:aldehyde dehydrogenase (NAD+)